LGNKIIVLNFSIMLLSASCATINMTKDLDIAGIDTASMTKTSSGLLYQDIVQGEGVSPNPGQKVLVHYTGWLLNGDQFDSSRDQGRPFSFNLGKGQVIKGWDEGVSTMKLGGKRKLVIPPELGYGARGAGDSIPPNAILIFEVELLGVL
jgi:peptidylprolyl isomerase